MSNALVKQDDILNGLVVKDEEIEEDFEEETSKTALRRSVEMVRELDKGIKQRFHLMVSIVKSIHDKKSFLETHSSFTSFCKDNFGWEKSYAYKMLRSGGVIENLLKANIVEDMSKLLKADFDMESFENSSESDDFEECTVVHPSESDISEDVDKRLPDNERVARELAKEKYPDKQRAIWKRAKANKPEGHITDKDVAIAREEIEENEENSNKTAPVSEEEEVNASEIKTIKQSVAKNEPKERMLLDVKSTYMDKNRPHNVTFSIDDKYSKDYVIKGKKDVENLVEEIRKSLYRRLGL